MLANPIFTFSAHVTESINQIKYNIIHQQSYSYQHSVESREKENSYDKEKEGKKKPMIQMKFKSEQKRLIINSVNNVFN